MGGKEKERDPLLHTSVDFIEASHSSSERRTERMTDASGYAAMSSSGKMAAG